SNNEVERDGDSKKSHLALRLSAHREGLVRRRTGRQPAKMPHRKPKRPKRSCAAVTASQPNLSVSDLQQRLERQARELDEARDERAALAEELRRSEAWTAQAQRLSRTGSWVYNATTMRFLYWSEECYRIWGFDPMQGP